MRNITIFTVPRYFKSSFAMLQYNSIRSWLALKPIPEIILCGDDEGIFEAAKILGIKHIPDIVLSDKRVPLLSDVFRKAQMVASHNIVAYLSTDIILMDDFLDVVDIVSSNLNRFMITGQRWDLDVENYIDFNNQIWEEELRRAVIERGKLHATCGMDYHIFEKGYGMNMPPFVAGRPGWDNWFVKQALQDKLNVVDATERILAIHQSHDYSHIVGGFKVGRFGEDAMSNCKLAGMKCAFTDNTNWKFLGDKLIRR